MKKIIVCIILLYHSFILFSQTSWKGTTSIVWSTASNWTAGVPTSTVDAIIGDANFTGPFQPALTSGSPVCKSLTIGAESKAATLTIGRNLSVYGAITIGANGTILHNTARTISLKGNWVNSGVYNATISTAVVTFSGTAQTITGNTTFRLLNINSGSVVTLNNGIVVNNRLTVSGTMDPTEAYAITGTGALTVNYRGTLRVKAVNFTNNYGLSGTVTLNGTSTVNYASATLNQNVSNAYTYGYLRISGGTTKTLTGNLPGLNSTTTTSGRIYIDAGIFDLLTYTANRNIAGGIITIAALAQLRIGGTNTFPNFTTKTIATTSTVEYYGTNQTVVAASYGNLVFSSSSGVATKTMPITSMTIAGNFTSYVGAGTGVSFTAGAAITVNKDVSMDAGSTFNGGLFTLTIIGNWINNGTFTGNASTVIFSGVNASLTGSGANNFNNLTCSASGINASASTSIQVGGNLATSGSGNFTHAAGGTLTMSGTAKTITGNGFNLANAVISGTITTAANIAIYGNFTVNGSFAASAGTVTFSGASKSISGSGTVTFFSVNTFGSISTARDFTVLGNFSVSIAGSFTATAGTATFNGTSSVLSGTANLYHVTINLTKTLGLGTNSILGIAGVFTKTGTLNVTTNVPNTVEYNASGAQSIVNTSYNNLVLSTGGTKTAAGAITVNNDFTINSSVTFNAVSYVFTLYRHFTNSGTFTSGTSDVQLRGVNAANMKGATSFYNLTVNKSSTAIWVTLLNNMTITNNLTMTQGNMQTGTNAVIITGTRLGTGTGLIIGTITQNHAFTNGTAYYFEGPNNSITFTAPSASLTSVTVTVTLGEIVDFDPSIECIFREYAISVPAGTYTNATLRFHYEDNELNAFDEPFLEFYKYNSGTSWDNLGVTTRNSTSNYAEKTAITSSITGRWTLSGQRNVVRWNGSVSGAWENPANWTTVSGSNMTNRVPLMTDAVEIGKATFVNNPVITTNQTINVLRYGSVQASTLTIGSNSLTIVGSARGNWTSNSAHILDVGTGSLTVGTDFSLSDGVSGHTIELRIGSGSATISNDLTQTANSSVNFTGNGTLTVAGHFNYTSGSFTSGSGTVVYTGTRSQFVAPVTYNNLSFTKSTERAVIRTPTVVNGNLTTSTGGELEIADTLTVRGNLTIGAGNNLIETGSRINIGGNWTTNGLFTVGNGSVNFNGTTDQSLNANIFNTILINKTSGILSLTGNITLNNDLTLNAGTLNLSTYTADRSNPGGILTLGSATALKVGGSSNFPNNFLTNTLSSTSTVEYNGTVAQSVRDIDYGNLTFTNGSALVKTLLGNITVNGDLLINSGATVEPDVYNVTLNGNMVHNGTFNPSSSTLTLTGNSKTISGSSALTLNNFTSAGGSYTISNSIISFAGNVFIDVAPSAVNCGNATITMDGDFINKGSVTSSGILNFSGTRLQTISLIGALVSSSTGVVNFNGNVIPVMNSTSSPSFYTLNVNNTGGAITPSQPWTVVVACNVAAGASMDFGSLTHTFLGNFTNNGTVTSDGKLKFGPIGSPFPASGTITLQASGASFTSTGEVEFGGTGSLTLAGTAPVLANVSITNTNVAGITPPTDWTIGQDLYIGPGSEFKCGASLTHTITESIINNGTLSGGTSTIIFDGASSSVEGVGTTNFNNLTIATGGDLTLNQSIGINRHLVNNGSFTATGRSVEFFGSATSVISGTTAPIVFDDFIQNKSSATTNLSVPVSIIGDMTLTSGIINTSSTNVLTIEDDATASPGTANSYVDGPIKKAGDDAFVFPVGDGTIRARIGISAPSSVSAVFQAQYLTGAYSNTSNVTAPLHHVSKLEYWVLNRTSGTDNVRVTLFWEDGNVSKINDLNNLVVARFNGTSWVNETQGGGVTGTVITGTVTSQVVSSFSPFSFGALTTSNPLPIELMDFTAEKTDGKRVSIRWSTASERNNDYFTIERSKDGQRFEKIGEVKGAGNSTGLLNYTITDESPLQGTSYYRLKQTDFDGSFSYSRLAAVEFDNHTQYQVYPNPVSLQRTSAFKIANIPEGAEVRVSVRTMQGEIIFTKQIENRSNEEIELNALRKLHAGVYFIDIVEGIQLYRQKLIVYE